jgi:predicted AlkP superfamily pyrophosphatase or phosphodiesterase
MTVYFSVVDDAGHRFGPESPETARTISQVDGYVARLVAGIESLGLSDRVNIVVTSDHGMSQLSPDRVIFIDDYIEMDKARSLSLGQYVALVPDPDDIDELYSALHGAHPALTIYRKGEIPNRLHLDGHRRTPPIVGIVENGWSASTHSWVERSANPFRGGGHGFDNREKNMEGILMLAGPAFRSGVRHETVDAVDVYNLLAASLGLAPSENDGNVSIMAEILEPATD